jgi:hypothetical protein
MGRPQVDQNKIKRPALRNKVMNLGITQKANNFLSLAEQLLSFQKTLYVKSQKFSCMHKAGFPKCIGHINYAASL